MFKKTIFLIVVISTTFWVSACSYYQQLILPSTTSQTRPSDTHTHVKPNQPRTRRVKVQPRPTKRPTQPRRSVRVNPQQIISAHNRVRLRLGLSPLSWSPSLARFSTNWANHLLKTKGCFMQHRPHSGQFKTDFGENLFWASPYRWSDGRSEIQNISSAKVVHEWAREAKFFSYQRNSCQPGQQCGHYTQMVWRNSRKVGCGLAVCADKSQVWVCSYDPPGNWQGQRPY